MMILLQVLQAPLGVNQNTIAGIVALLTAAMVAWNTYKGNQRDVVLESVKATGEANHVLSNGAMSAQYVRSVEAAEQVLVLFTIIAEIRRGEGDYEAVHAAEKKLEQLRKSLAEHETDAKKADLVSPSPTITTRVP